MPWGCCQAETGLGEATFPNTGATKMSKVKPQSWKRVHSLQTSYLQQLQVLGWKQTVKRCLGNSKMETVGSREELESEVIPVLQICAESWTRVTVVEMEVKEDLRDIPTRAKLQAWCISDLRG